MESNARIKVDLDHGMVASSNVLGAEAEARSVKGP